MIEQVWIVQSRDSYLFLYPEDGTLGLTPDVSRAGLFTSKRDAVEAGIEEIGDSFIVFGFFKDLPD